MRNFFRAEVSIEVNTRRASVSADYRKRVRDFSLVKVVDGHRSHLVVNDQALHTAHGSKSAVGKVRR